MLKQGKVDEAIPILRDAVRYASRLPEAHLALGNALREQGDLEGALAAYRQAVELRPGWAEAYSNLGSILQETGQLPEAVRVLRKSVELKGDYVDARWNLSLSLLASGDFEAGWPEYEWRRKLKGDGLSSRNFAQPEWNGCSLRGRTILVLCEQGLGDTIQFIRYVSMMKDRGAQVIVECQPRLRGLLESIGGFRVIARGEPLPAFDTYARLLSLPAIFGTTLDSIPAQIPYLKADKARAIPWEGQLSGGGFKIGIAWQGSTGYKGDRRRSLPLRAFAPLAAVPGVRLFSLQQGEGAGQIDDAGFPVHVFNPQPDAEGAFLDTAAIIGNLDLIVTSDTAMAHLAGALGAKVWVALACAPDWRWMLGRNDSPWYPTAKLFRQSAPGNWTGVFERMAAELAGLVRCDTEPPVNEPLMAPSTPGQLLDRISILRIKAERIADARKLRLVRAELSALERVRHKRLNGDESIAAIESELRHVNDALWQIEEDLRHCERNGDFGPRFVDLARSVYANNDPRSRLKQRIDEITRSGLVEVKSYDTSYNSGSGRRLRAPV